MLTFFSRWPRPRRILTITCAAIIAVCVLYLILAPSPGEAGMASAQEAAVGEGHDPKEVELETSHYRISGLWWGSVANIVLCLVVLGFSRWLTRPLADPKRVGFEFGIEKNQIPSKNAHRWIFGSVLDAIAITLTGTLPRMGFGLWHDEDKTVRNFIVGQNMRSQSSGEVKYRAVTWEETVWNHRTPNHTLYGILARLAHDVFPRMPDATKPYLNEWPLRLPALMGALAGLAMLAAALSALGFHRAAMIAPLLLSVHPWFLRYASEARGYALLFFFVPLCVFLLAKALQQGRWKWWVGLGIAEFLTIYSVLNGAHFLAVMNLAALVWIFTSPGRAVLFRRWLVTCAVAMVLGIQFMSAFLPQFKTYVDSTAGHTGDFDRKMAKDNVTSFISGARYQTFTEKHAPSFKEQIEGGAPIRTGLLTLMVAGLGIAGAVRLCRAGWQGIALLATCILPAPFFYIHAWLGDAHIFYWYTIVGLPFFWALVAIGAGWVSKKIVPRGGAALPVAGGMALMLTGVIFFTTLTQREFQNGRPIEFTRESVYATRSVLDPTDPRYDQILTINISRHPMVYDGAAQRAKNVEKFLEWLRIADETERPLFINYGSQVQLKRNVPDMLKYVEDPTMFETIEEYPGFDPGSDRTVKRYLPGSYRP